MKYLLKVEDVDGNLAEVMLLLEHNFVIGDQITLDLEHSIIFVPAELKEGREINRVVGYSRKVGCNVSYRNYDREALMSHDFPYSDKD